MGRRSDKQLLARLRAESVEYERRCRERRERRVANGTAAKPRPTCRCPAYPWPHRVGGGKCRFPDPPLTTWEGKPGRHPGTFGRVSGGSSSLRRRILAQYELHPIRDRAYIRRWLPKLYVAMSRREGWPWVYQTMRGWVPAMLVTEHGVPAGLEPYNPPDLLTIIMQATSRKWALSEPPIKRRLEARAERAPVRNGYRGPDGATERASCRTGIQRAKGACRTGYSGCAASASTKPQKSPAQQARKRRRKRRSQSCWGRTDETSVAPEEQVVHVANEDADADAHVAGKRRQP